MLAPVDVICAKYALYCERTLVMTACAVAEFFNSLTEIEESDDWILVGS